MYVDVVLRLSASASPRRLERLLIFIVKILGLLQLCRINVFRIDLQLECRHV